ncbi:MAG: hypothetical protein H0V43_00755 [Gemmatimonadales bacterium]|nr:hypothetical protein [Gemmatimonadales bacterium]
MLIVACGHESTSEPTFECTGTATTICPDDDIAAKVDAAPPGTAFQLRAALHRLQQLSPKAGQSFADEAGAVLSGARLLTEWAQEGNHWIHGGQSQAGEVRLASSCQPTRPRCAFPEEFFIDDILLQHIGRREEVGPGKWYFDYAADRVYIADVPTGRRVEISVLPWAIYSAALNVTLENLIVEKYASPA